MEEKEKINENEINEQNLSAAENAAADAVSEPGSDDAVAPDGTAAEGEVISGSASDVKNDEPAEKESKNIFGKKKKVQKKDRDKAVAEELGLKMAEISEKHIRLAAEFDNYRKRTLKEKSDLLKYGAENALKNILPVVDDFERALKTIENIPDEDPVKAGILLIYNKFRDYLLRQGIKEIECKDGAFNVDEHEAITRFPAPSEEMKGKVIDVVEKGYLYHDKVIRFAKVVIGE
jgi:molecular chaperone GrpE